MILGELSRRGRASGREPAAALGHGATAYEDGPLHLAWARGAQASDADGVLVVVDGFLLGDLDTPTRVAEAWRRTGSALAERLRGAFTVLVWDAGARAGVLVADHFSSRVCLLHEDGPRLTFATHLPALMRHLPRTPEPEPAVIVPWIAPRYLQGGRTMARGVVRLEGATLLELSEDLRQPRRYWAPSYEPRRDVPRAERPALVREALREAIAARIPAGETAGVILSGGLDSSIVAAIASEVAPGRVRAYSTLFPDWPHADESGRIAATTAHLGVPSTRAVLRPQGALRLALEYLRDSGTVPGGPGLLVERPLLERAAADGVHVMLDGQGGDEVFGHSPYLVADTLRRGDLVGVLHLLAHLPGVGRRRAPRAVLRQALVDFGLKPALGRRLPRRFRFTGDLPVPGWMSPKALAVFDEVHEPWRWMRPGVPRWWAYQSWLLSQSRQGSALGEYTWLRGAALGVESRTPLFDIELTELMLSLPPESNFGRINRPLARAAVAGLLPEAVRMNARKANIGPFYFDVLTGPDLAVMRELLLDPRARVREWAIGEELDRTLRRTVTRQDPDWLGWATVVFRLATAECWLRWREDPAWVEATLERDDLPAPEAALTTV